MSKKNRKICVVINNRANYARIKYFLKAAQKNSRIELSVILGASANLQRYGELNQTLKKDGFNPKYKISTIVEGENPIAMAKSTALSIIELSSIFEKIKPDIVLTVADRFETLATAIASSYLNIFLAHTQGGEVSGSIDESVRHSITKLAHIHFPATKKASEFIVRLGEDPKTVFLTGCPAIDLVAESDLVLNKDKLNINKIGVGGEINLERDFLLVLQHPITSEYGEGFSQINETIKAVYKLSQKGMQVLWLWPNVDAGSDDVSNGIRTFRENIKTRNIRFFKNFQPEEYVSLLANAKCIIGNSSSGIREASFLGTPCVNIGTRQTGRERGENVIDVNYKSDEIYNAILKQIKNGKYPKSNLFGDGNSGKKIAQILSTVEPKIQKKISYSI